MNTNETTIHPSSNEVDVSNYRQLYGLQQWEKSMHGWDREYKQGMCQRDTNPTKEHETE